MESETSRQTSKRNSSYELLRILAMFMIVARHYALEGPFNIFEQGISVRKIFFLSFYYGMGKVGVVLFFAITAWFLCDAKQDLQSNIKKIWILERELLFWSILITALCVTMKQLPFTADTVFRAFTPMLHEVWWYPTSYALFLLLAPIITYGLRALSKWDHLVLCILLSLAWSILPFLTIQSPSI